MDYKHSPDEIRKLFEEQYMTKLYEIMKVVVYITNYVFTLVDESLGFVLTNVDCIFTNFYSVVGHRQS